MRKLFIIILLLLIYSATFPQSQKELLYKAYQDSSYELLEQFFENWRLEKTPITDEEYENLTDIEKDVYDLFYEFFEPFNLNKLASFKGQKEWYKDEKYVIIEPNISYKFIENLELDYIVKQYLRKNFTDSQIVRINDKYFDSIKDSYMIWLYQDYYGSNLIKGFRPRIKFENAEPLYYNPDYDTIITHFIGSPIIYVDSTGNEVWFSRSKLDFIEQYIYVHFESTYWEIRTSPIAQLIIFDAKRDNAVIEYYNPSKKWKSKI